MQWRIHRLSVWKPSDSYTFRVIRTAVLLPLYETYGTMFRMLDAGCHHHLWRKNTGIYCGKEIRRYPPALCMDMIRRGIIVFASGSQIWSGCVKNRPFPPGHYYKDGEEFVCYCEITKGGWDLSGWSGAGVPKYSGEKTGDQDRKAAGVAWMRSRISSLRRAGFVACVRSGSERRGKTQSVHFTVGCKKMPSILKYCARWQITSGDERTE